MTHILINKMKKNLDDFLYYSKVSQLFSTNYELFTLKREIEKIYS